MAALLAKLGVSLVAILALAGVARLLKLGGDVRLRDAAHARDVAAELVCGFEAVDVALDKAGMSALLRDAQGRQLLIRQHGVAFVGRLLDQGIDAQLDKNFLTVETSDRFFGRVTLNLGEAAPRWASGFRDLPA